MENKDHEKTAETIFKRHHDSYMQQSVEVIKSLSGVGQQVMADYEGRVIYELLQNAFDKAESKISVQVQDGHLYVANDGQKFSYMLHYDYNGTSGKRGDFQSICSFANSTKDPSVSIGNKGLGFKSVFALSATGYVDLFTQGIVIDAQVDSGTNGGTLPIDFRIYDVYNDVTKVPLDLEADLSEHIKTKITQVQVERADRGVPGYFFPIRLHEQDPSISALFSEGYVTIIRIPLDEHGKYSVKNLLKEIRGVHFRFVGLRVKKRLEVRFQFAEAGLDFERKVFAAKNQKNLVSYDLKDKLQHLSQEANLKVNSPVVAIRFHGEDRNGGGKLYNYLPTSESSPFVHADFHADFQTSVNRRHIVFDGSSAVGRYNQALLKACVELYLITLYASLSIAEKPPIDFKWIDLGRVRMRSSLIFRWRYLELSSGSTQLIGLVKEVIGFSLWHFLKIAELLANLASHYFSTPRSRKGHTRFFSVIERFISNSNARELRWSDWNNGFYSNLAKSLVAQGAKVIPSENEKELGIVPGRALFLRSMVGDNRNVMVPPFAGIAVSSFADLPARFQSQFGIRSFTSRQDIFKHFRQATASGEIDRSATPLTEEEQQMLLRSIASFLPNDFESENQNLLCTHRYKDYIKRESSQNTDANQANFAISTIFLKTIDGFYRPAQLCAEDEIHPAFLPSEWSDEMKSAVLLYLGVSPHKNFLFVEGALYEALKDGLNFIPRPMQQADGAALPLSHSHTVEHVRVVYKGQAFHPAEINEAYPFLKRFDETEIRSELVTLEAKAFYNWPKEYTHCLYKRLEPLSLIEKSNLMRLYSHTYAILYEHQRVFLIAQNGTLSFSESDNFIVANNRDDFEMIDGSDMKLLALTNTQLQYLPNWASNRVVKFTEVMPEFEYQVEEHLQLMNDVKKKLPFIALAISHSSSSTFNYSENHDALRELQQKVHDTTIWLVKELKQSLELVGEQRRFTQKRAFAFDKQNQVLYLEQGSSKKVMAEAVAKYIFNIRSMASEFELILFWKQLEVLKADYKEEELAPIMHALDKDYDKKLSQFLSRLAEQCQVEVERFKGNWNIHRSGQESELLCELAAKGRLELLDKEIKLANSEMDGLFHHLQLVIDKAVNISLISDLMGRLQQQPLDLSAPFMDQLKRLNQVPHLMATLLQLVEEIKVAFPGILDNEKPNENATTIQRQLEKKNELHDKWTRISAEASLVQVDLPPTYTGTLSPNSQRTPKSISTSNRNPREDAINHERTGKNGEERLLRDAVLSMLALPTAEIEKGIQEIAKALRERMKENSLATVEYLTALIANCHECINNIEDLRLELVDLMHISSRFPFAPFDLVIYENGKVKFIEVKTTASEPGGAKDSFEFSSSELIEAIHQPDYEIVRITPSRKIPFGNPFFGKMTFPNDVQLGTMLLRAEGFIFEYEIP